MMTIQPSFKTVFREQSEMRNENLQFSLMKSYTVRTGFILRHVIYVEISDLMDRISNLPGSGCCFLS